MSFEDSRIKEDAENYARENKKSIAKDKILKYISESDPISVFMAGSPGAGKTEASVQLIIKLTGKKDSILRIDPDELRDVFKEYNGKNSNLFQHATSILVEKIHDLAIDKKQSFIFDTTFSKIEKATNNIKRSLDHKRLVQIIYVYQDPTQAWEFVKARELKDGRCIPKDSFIKEYFNARSVVNKAKKDFPSIKVDLVVKNVNGTTQYYRENIDNIDFYVKENYTVDILNKVLL